MFSKWTQSLKKRTYLITKPKSYLNNLSMPTLLKRSQKKFLKKKTKAAIIVLVTAILALFTLLGFLTFTPIKQVDEYDWPHGGFLVVSGGFDPNYPNPGYYPRDVEVIGKPDDLTKLHNNSNCQFPPNLPYSMWRHSSAFFKGYLITCGGETDGNTYTSTNTTCLKWKPGSPKWTDGPNMWNQVLFKSGFAVTTSLGVWFIDPVWNTRSYLLKDINNDLEPGPHTNTQRWGSCVTNAFGDSVIIIGGVDLDYEYLDSVELYDHGMNFSKNLPPLLTPRMYHSCSSTGPLVVVAAGNTPSHNQAYPTPLQSVEVLDLTSPFGWRVISKLPRSIESAMMVNLRGKLVYVGGKNFFNPKKNSIPTYHNTSIKTTVTHQFKTASVGLKTYREYGHSVVPMKEEDFCDEI